MTIMPQDPSSKYVPPRTSYAPNLAGVASRMQDQAQTMGCRPLFAVGDLLEHIAGMDQREESSPELTALACSVAFAWLLETGAV